MPSVYVSSASLSQLCAEECDSNQWIILLFWSAVSTSTGDARTPTGNLGGPQPPLPPPDHPQVIGHLPPPVPIDVPNSDRSSSAYYPTMETPARTASAQLSADDASLTTQSRTSSVRSSSSVRRLSADDASLVPTISSEKSESEHPEPSDADLNPTTPSVSTSTPRSASTNSSRSRSDSGPKKNKNKAPSKDKSQDAGASSSGLTPAERALSLLLPST